MCVCCLQNSSWQDAHTAVRDWPSVFFLLYVKINAFDTSRLTRAAMYIFISIIGCSIYVMIY